MESDKLDITNFLSTTKKSAHVESVLKIASFRAVYSVNASGYLVDLIPNIKKLVTSSCKHFTQFRHYRQHVVKKTGLSAVADRTLETKNMHLSLRAHA